MKKSILIIGSALMLCLSVTSCGEKSALEINIDELNSACDFVDALDQIVREMSTIIADGELASDEEELFEKLSDKAEEVSNAAESKYDRSEAEECPSWETMREKSEKVQEYM